MSENSVLGNLEKIGKALEGIGSAKKVSRRDALKVGAATAALTIIGNTACAEYGDTDLLAFKNSPKWESQDSRWQQVRVVRLNDSLSKIASEVYPDFNNNQSYYTDRLRTANQQDKNQGTFLIEGQTLYVPHPGTPTFGFAPGEAAILEGEKVDGKYLPTKIEQVNPDKNTFIYSYNGKSSIPFKVGTEISTSRGLKAVAILKGYGSVPPRVVFELTKPRDLTKR